MVVSSADVVVVDCTSSGPVVGVVGVESVGAPVVDVGTVVAPPSESDVGGSSLSDVGVPAVVSSLVDASVGNVSSVNDVSTSAAAATGALTISEDATTRAASTADGLAIAG